MALDWLNMANPFVDTEAPNALAPGGPTGGVPSTGTLSPALMAILAYAAPEEMAKIIAEKGMRINPAAFRTAEAPLPVPGSPEPGPAFGDPNIVNRQATAKPTGGPAGLAGVPGQSSVLQALGAVKALQPPASPLVPAPAAPRIDSPPVYKPDPSMLLGLLQMMGGAPGGGQMPTLAQLMGGMR